MTGICTSPSFQEILLHKYAFLMSDLFSMALWHLLLLSLHDTDFAGVGILQSLYQRRRYNCMLFVKTKQDTREAFWVQMSNSLIMYLMQAEDCMV